MRVVTVEGVEGSRCTKRVSAPAFARRVVELVKRLPPRVGASGLCGDELQQSADSILADWQMDHEPASDEAGARQVAALAEVASDCQDWLDLLGQMDIVEPSMLNGLMQEAAQLSALASLAVRNNSIEPAEETGLWDSRVAYLKPRR